MGKPFFCVLMGPDGAGKSTLLGNLKQLAPNWRYVSADPEDLYPIEGLEFQNWTLQTHPREYVKNMRPLTRSAFYINTLSIEYEYHLAPALAAGDVVICDSYWYRFLAKEQVFNPDGVELFRQFTEFLPKPDLILWLDLPLEEALLRKGEVRAFEAIDDSATGYLHFQQGVLHTVRKFIEDLVHASVDATRPPREIAFALKETVEKQIEILFSKGEV